MKVVLIITFCFFLFALSLLINVYADANSDVIDKRNEIDQMKIDIKNTKAIIETLESEESYWKDRLQIVEDYLEEREELAKLARDDYEVALRNKVQTVEDIEFVEAIKKIWEDRQAEVPPAELNVVHSTTDLENFEQRLADEKSKLRELEKLLPDAEEDIEDLITIANRARPVELYGSHQSIIISIILSEGCLVSDTCPNYSELADVYDNSNRYISGDFIEVETDKTRPIYELVVCEGNCSTDETLRKVGDETLKIWKRDIPIFGENTIGWYEYSTIPVLTFVDPDDETRTLSKQIIIEPQLPEGFNRNTGLQYLGENATNDGTLTYGVDRSLNGCNSAVIGWNPYGDELLADTWNYFYSNCSTETTFNDTISTYYPQTEFTDCHSWCEHLNWIEKAKIIAKTAFGVILD